MAEKKHHPVSRHPLRIVHLKHIWEMLLVGMVALLAVIALALFLPNADKNFRDTLRASDLNQIKSALDKYQAANGSYPFSTRDFEIENTPWAGSWEPFLPRVPKDPLPPFSYAYISDGDAYQLYAYFENQNPIYSALFCKGSCGPGGAYNAGLASANSSLTSFELPQPLKKLSQGKQMFTIETDQVPTMQWFTIDPLDPKLDQNQQFALAIKTPEPVESASVTIRMDSGSGGTFPLTLSQGTNVDGVWTVSWEIKDSYEIYYSLIIRATDTAGNKSRVRPTFGNTELVGQLLLGR